VIDGARTVNVALPVLSGGVLLSCTLKVAEAAAADGTVNVPMSQPVGDPPLVVLNTVVVIKVAEAPVTVAPP
jgi:hypothetical protein